MRLAARVNGVSRPHGQVSRNLWREPVARTVRGRRCRSVTSPTACTWPTWMAGDMMELLDRAPRAGLVARPARRPRHVGPGAVTRPRGALAGAPPPEADPPRLHPRGRAAPFRRAARRKRPQVVGAGTLLDPDALTIGFARRFATYKRANLIFSDLERLRRLLVDPRAAGAARSSPARRTRPTRRARKCCRACYRFTRDPQLRGADRVRRGLRHAPRPPARAGRRRRGSTCRACRSRPRARAA